VPALRPRSSAMRTLVSRIVFHMRGARRASICSPMSDDIGVDAGDPAQRVREQELVMVGEMPVERSAHLLLLLYQDKRSRPKGTDPRQTKVGPEEKIPPLRCGAQHEHQAPTQSEAHQLGTARWACVRAGKYLLTPRPHFTAHHARLVTRWLLLRTALLFVRSAVRLVYAELPGTVAVRCRHKHSAS
jgi:hypothetical protein